MIVRRTRVRRTYDRIMNDNPYPQPGPLPRLCRIRQANRLR